jgi:tripartite-type tricarboxylate transporter receptor subunit TctC
MQSPITRRRLLAATAAAVAATVLPWANAQAPWPSQVIKLVVPFTPGSTSDVTARAIAAQISGPLGQQVIVDNRPGANGAIGMQAVARAKPDGHTFVVGTVSSTVVPAIITKTPGFDLFKDFTPVGTIANTPLVLTVSKDSPYRSVADLVAAAKKAPGTLNYGNSAGLYQLAMEAFNQQADIDLLAVPFKGPAEATSELLGGLLDVNPDSLGSAGRLLSAGRIRALAVLGAGHAQSMPELPTMQELGYRNFDFNGWIGILAPAGTPTAVVQRLQQEIAKAVNSPDVRKTYQGLGLDAVALSPEQYRDTMARDSAAYQRVARAAGIEAQ